LGPKLIPILILEDVIKISLFEVTGTPVGSVLRVCHGLVFEPAAEAAKCNQNSGDGYVFTEDP
jgi:hypothetical protein